MGKEFVLDLCFFHVVGEWQVGNPVIHELVGVGASGLVLEDLSESGNSVVLGVVVLSLLSFLFLGD